MNGSKVPDTTCSIHRSLGVLGERWTLLIVREAVLGATRFAEFREHLGIAPNLLTERLATLVEYGVLVREPYREPGARARFEYHLTDAGRELSVILAALQQWGDAHVPHPGGPAMLRRHARSGEPLHVGFVREDGREVPATEVAMLPTANYRP